MHLTIKDTRKKMISLHQLWRLPHIFNFPTSQKEKGKQMIDQELLFQNFKKFSLDLTHILKLVSHKMSFLNFL